MVWRGKKFVSKMFAKSLAAGRMTGQGLQCLLVLRGVGRGYNVAVGSVQKETASPLRRDCRARATHPGAVGLYGSKSFSICQIAKRAEESPIWYV